MAQNRRVWSVGNPSNRKRVLDCQDLESLPALEVEYFLWLTFVSPTAHGSLILCELIQFLEFGVLSQIFHPVTATRLFRRLDG
jgi:hypothetical protein